MSDTRTQRTGVTKGFVAAFLVLVLGTGTALALDGTWVGNYSGSWSDETKWVGGNIADGVGATADLANVTLSISNKSITMDTDRTIGKVMLGASGRNLDIGIGSKILTLDDTYDALTNPGGDGIVEITYRVDSSRNGSIGVPIQLNNNLLISNPNSSGNTGILISGGLSSANGDLTISNNSHLNSRTKFNSTVSDGTGTITFDQTAGWAEFNNANTFSGSTVNRDGTLVLGNSLALQSSALDTLNSVSGTASVGLRITGTAATALTLGGLTGNKNLVEIFNTTTSGYGTLTNLTLNPGEGKTNSYSGVIANSAAGLSLTKKGSGTQILAGGNTFSGPTTITAGTLAFGKSDVLPDTDVSIGTATLDASTYTDTVGTLALTGDAIINLGEGGRLVFADSRSNDWSSGTLTITGTFASGASLKFGTSNEGLTDDQIKKITAPGAPPLILSSSGFLLIGKKMGTILRVH